MEGTGARLKKIRLEKGFSLEEVHKRTKIHLNILKALEEDASLSLSPIYLKGFLKIYCKFLGVDPAEYTSGYKEPQPLEATQGMEKDQSVPFLKTASLKFGNFRLNKKVRRMLKVSLIFIVCSIVLFRLGKLISSRRHSLPLPREVKIPAKKIPAADSQKTANTSKQKPKASGYASVKSISTGIRLGILAREDCWVTLKADGRIVFHSTLKKGKSESWQAKDKMELSLSNAGAVDLIVNGERISPLGKKGQARKNILITKEGLNVQ